MCCGQLLKNKTRVIIIDNHGVRFTYCLLCFGNIFLSTDTIDKSHKAIGVSSISCTVITKWPIQSRRQVLVMFDGRKADDLVVFNCDVLFYVFQLFSDFLSRLNVSLLKYLPYLVLLLNVLLEVGCMTCE